MMATAAGYLRWIRDRWRMNGFDPARDQAAVMVLLFHGLFRDSREVTGGPCDPQQGITVAFFAEFVESLLAGGAVIRELEDAVRRPQRGLTAVITFDDGYFNNIHALDVLQQFGIPATFFISTRHVEEQKAFWWDAVYRHAKKQGASAREIRQRIRALKRLRAEGIESRIVQWFGAGALTPVSDWDRPFTTSELTDFARSRYVFLGNHTSDHAILPNYDPEGVRDQILDAQRFITRISGTAPTSIAYPNGNYDAQVLQIARSAGLEIGLTVRTGLNVATRQDAMELRRLTVWGVPSARRQGRVLGSMAAVERPGDGSNWLRHPARR